MPVLSCIGQTRAIPFESAKEGFVPPPVFGPMDDLFCRICFSQPKPNPIPFRDVYRNQRAPDNGRLDLTSNQKYLCTKKS